MRAHALLFGINYTSADGSEALKGCINDASNMSNWLSTNGFTNIKMFTDDTPEGIKNCTKTAITGHIKSVIQSTLTSNIDLLWIHYSGHGSYRTDLTLDESDFQDECLVPIDYKTAGYISDDEIMQILRLANPNTRIVLMIDACHSGTICDLGYEWDIATKYKTHNTRGLYRGNILLISGCRDNQTSADAFIYDTRKYGGALTDTFLRVVQSESRLLNDIFSLFTKVRENLKMRNFDQIPQLTSSFDILQAPGLFTVPPTPAPPTSQNGSSAPSGSGMTLFVPVVPAPNNVKQCCTIM